MTAPQDFIEFETTGGEYWACEAWSELRERFDLEISHLPTWHAALTGQGRCWEIVWRRYRVASLTNPDEDALKAWNEEALAAKLSIPRSTIDEEIAGAVKHWEIVRAQGTVAVSATPLADGQFERLTNFSKGLGMDEQRIALLLESYNFQHIQDPRFRAELAARIISLSDFLQAPHSRAQARTILRLESSVHTAEASLVQAQNAVARLIESDPERRVKGGEIDSLNKRVAELEDRLSSLTDDHQKTCEAIGANEIDLTARKRIYIETVAHLIDQCRIYESDPENWRIDGTWTPSEIEWLTEASDERPSQYRFDIALRNQEIMDPENFWNPDYVPTKIPRKICEKLARIMKHLSPGDDIEIPAPVEVAHPDRGDDDDDFDPEDEDAEGAPVSDDLESGTLADQQPLSIPAGTPFRSDSGDCIGVF